MSTFMPPASTPPSLMVPVAYGAGTGAEETAARGTYGPVIGMLAVVVVLAAAAVAVGRLCFGRRALGHDPEAWVERRCGPCVGVTRAPACRGSGGGVAKDEEGGAAASLPAAPTEQPPEGTERGEPSSGGGS